MKRINGPILKLCSTASLALIVYAALAPAKWQWRPMWGWKTEHFVGFALVTALACVAWPRPLIVGVILAATAASLEALQGITPDRIPDLPTALSGVGGALVASVAAKLLGRLFRAD
jgi:hypothetical protein